MPDAWLRHSTTYRETYRTGFFRGFEEGFRECCPGWPDDLEVECTRAWLKFLGEEWLGTPSSEVWEKISSLDARSELEALIESLTDETLGIETWDDLFLSVEFPSTSRLWLR